MVLIGSSNRRNNGLSEITNCSLRTKIFLTVVLCSIFLIQHLLQTYQHIQQTGWVHDYNDKQHEKSTHLDHQEPNHKLNSIRQNQHGTSDLIEIRPKSQPNEHVDTKTAPLPQWITDYFAFHKKTREEFPGTELFTNPNAPKLLVRLCLGLCGGLHDRLGQLPLDLIIANETQRILLIQWHKPHPLEEYMLPNEVDWRVPANVGYDDMKAARNHPYFNYTDGFDLDAFEKAIDQVKHGDLSQKKVVNLKVLGDQKGEIIASRLRKAGETDLIDDTTTFGRIFWAFFRPHPKVQSLIDEQKQNLQITSGNYIAVHCRTRHPKGWPKDKPPPRAEVEKFPADRSDIVFDGYEKEHTVAVATHAIQCARNLLKKDHMDEPIYLMTDTFKVTNFMLGDESPFDIQTVNLVARTDSIPSIHIDRKKGRPIWEHYGTFMDLFLMVDARCISFGIGNFGRFASKISRTFCVNQHRKVEWDTHDTLEWFAPSCRQGDGVDE